MYCHIFTKPVNIITMEFLLQLLAELINPSEQTENFSDIVNEEVEVEEVLPQEEFFSLMNFH